MIPFLNTFTEPINLVELQKGSRSYWHAQRKDEAYYFRILPAALGCIAEAEGFLGNGGALYSGPSGEDVWALVGYDFFNNFTIVVDRVGGKMTFRKA